MKKSKFPVIALENLVAKEKSAIKIGPFGSQLKKTELTNHGIHVLGIENVINYKFNELGERYISDPKFQDLRSVQVLPGDILITMMGTIGELAIVPDNITTSIMDSHLLRIRVNTELCDRKYIVWAIKCSSEVKRSLDKNARGAIMQGLNSGIIKGLPIPLPPLPEQKRIAAILDKADAIRRKRQAAIKLADDFLRATFLDMFGDPVTNPKGWEIKKFIEIGKLDRGVSKHRPRNAPELLGGPYPLIQTGDVANSNGYIRNYKSTYSAIGLKQSKMWSAGTLCITIAANIAKTGILTFDACFPDSVVGFWPNTLSTTEYVQYWLGFLQKILEESAPESAQKNINLEILRNLDIPLPPIESQKKFSDHVEKVQSIKARLTALCDDTSLLFNALIQRAFRGDL